MLIRVRLRIIIFLIFSNAPLILYGSGHSSEPLTDPIPRTIEFGGIKVKLNEVAGGMVSPVHGTYARGFPNQLYVVDQIGIVYQINLDSGEKTVFLDIQDRIATNIGGYDERGLLGIAFHPQYRLNGLFYTYSSEEVDGEADFPYDVNGSFGGHQSVINEWHVNNPLNTTEVTDPSSRREVMRIDQPSRFHNGGTMAFNKRGYLYIALGNGGPLDTPQDNSNIHGSVLRIVPNRNYAPVGNHALSENGEYLIPAGNPFVTDPESLDEIFAHGFRNVWGISVDRRSNKVYAGEVGNNDIEEVNQIKRGRNYGFPIKEGDFCFVGTGGRPTGQPGVTDPSNCPDELLGLSGSLAEYDHDEGVAVIGGYVYRGTKKQNRCLRGLYFFGDYNGRLFYLDKKTIREASINGQDSLGSPLLGMAEDARGELYLLVNNFGITLGNTGRVIRIEESTYIGDRKWINRLTGKGKYRRYPASGCTTQESPRSRLIREYSGYKDQQWWQLFRRY
ncbi:MAG: PQQ-dependent sugar dehydrogenase [Pseudomonadota bacterium]|nr:PQQ-dependent sugar dehydrogenase [Pseudomonadota bacterium]